MIKTVGHGFFLFSVMMVTACTSLQPLQRDASNPGRNVPAKSSEETSPQTALLSNPTSGSSRIGVLKEPPRESLREEKPNSAAAAKPIAESARAAEFDAESLAFRKNETIRLKLDAMADDARRAIAQGDFAKAAQLYRKIADDDTSAQIALGDLYANGRGVPVDYGTAIKWYQSAHKAGDGAALARIAYLTTQGLGVVKDMEKGVQLLQAAATKGDGFARGKLGLMYMRGVIESKLWICGPVAQACVSEAAVTMFKNGVADNDAESSYFLGEFYRIGRGVAKNEDEGQRLLKKSADQGHPRAMLALGTLYLQGSETIPQDVGKGVAWLKAAAGQNLADAQNVLGVLYSDGKQVPTNTKEAVMWYQRAADQGHAIAQANLAHMYRFGRGVKRELITAYKWYTIASQQFLSSSPAMKVAADISKRALEATMPAGDIEKARTQAFQWLERNQKIEL